MEKRFLDRVEDNAAVRVWSEKTQQEKGVDLVPTVEEYMALLNCPKIQADRAYSRPINVLTFLKKLISITGMSEQWVAAHIKQKGDSKCIPWGNLRDLILAHPDLKKRVDVFALSLYGLIIFPKALRHIDEAVSDLFDRLDKGTTPVPAILAETFRSLNDYSPLRELVATPRRDVISEERWIAILQNLRVEYVEWRAPWLIPDEILYRCGDFDWVPLAGIWGASGYAPLLVLRQYRSRQFIPATRGLAQCEFSYKDDGYKKKVREISNTWNQTRRTKGFTTGPMTTPEYEWWWSKRINNNISRPTQENTQPIEEHLRVVPSELEIIKQDFEKMSSELERR
ncbi:hypothetical protein CXB51_007547 [Gossypium anomalum]|uniref:DUF7745 domain-containing protein n=1 Tax=Gossypium anomalum TaxID=47600 RepID=A0A8J5YUI7_9ROSI|nr:hypothetical protein CXB51_007547 [Gossypium anomalum]